MHFLAGVVPDMEVEVMLKNVFGKTAPPVRKFMRMYYWMPKFTHLSPWPLPKPVPDDPMALAKLALQRITSVDLLTKIETFNVKKKFTKGKFQ
jgi:evolutionarily conserved signaling intermediate in Toll pathway